MYLKKTIIFSALLLMVWSVPALSMADTVSDNEAVTKMDEIVVSATRTKKKVIDVPGSASIVGNEQIRQDQPFNVSEILETVPGVDISGGGSHSKQPALRGLPESQTIIKVDGARQNYVQQAGDAQSTILVDPEILKLVEIIRGPSSTMHGGGGIGGVISLKTIDAEDLLKRGEKVGAKLKSGFRSGDHSRNYSGTVYGRFSNFDIVANSTYRTFGDYKNSDTDPLESRKDMDGSSLNNFLKISYLPSECRRFQLNFMNYEHDYEYMESSSEYQTNQNRIIAKFESDSENQLLNLSITAMHSKRDEDQSRVHPLGGELKNEMEFSSSGLDAQNTMYFNALRFNHSLIAGFDYYRDDYSPETSDEMTAYANPPGYGEDFGGFIHDEIELTEKLILSTGVRYTYYKRSGDNSNASDGSESRWSPKITLNWEPVGWLGVYTGYSEAYRPPLVSEMYTELDSMYGPMHVVILSNPELKAETAKNFEIGTKIVFDDVFSSGDAIRLKVSLFREQISDLITIKTIRDINPPHDFEKVVKTVNLDSVERQGGEVEAVYANRFLNLSAGYSKVKGRDNDTDEDAGESPGILNIRSDVKIPGLFCVLGWKSKLTESFDDGEEHYHNYHIHSLSLRWFPEYSLFEDFALSLGITNIFDRKYEAYHFKDSSPGMARSYCASLSYKY